MITSGDISNPTGIEFTQEQRDESFRDAYWTSAVRFGLQYYVAGRFATTGGFVPVSANLLHHAIELLLKACLARDDSVDTIRNYGQRGGYRHNLQLLWAEFKRRNASKGHEDFDAVVTALDKFEDIRYPEKLIQDGAEITIDVFEYPDVANTNANAGARYELKLPLIDRLMGALFEALHTNPEFFLWELEMSDKRVDMYYSKVKETFLGLAPKAY